MTRVELEERICEWLKIESTTSMIRSQITRLTSSGFTHKEIARAMYYFVEVLGNTPDPKYGIGIVPVISIDAEKYFYNLEKELNRLDEQAKIAEQVKSIQTREVKPQPHRKKGVKLIDLNNIK